MEAAAVGTLAQLPNSSCLGLVSEPADSGTLIVWPTGVTQGASKGTVMIPGHGQVPLGTALTIGGGSGAAPPPVTEQCNWSGEVFFANDAGLTKTPAQ
jgi:hypothetical protein